MEKKAKKAKKARRNKDVKPVMVKKPYSLGLGYSSKDPKQSLEAILGKHQAKYMHAIFAEMNKFTKTAVMTVVPELFAQLLNILKGEKQHLIALALDAEAVDNPAAEGGDIPAKNNLEIVKGDKKDIPQSNGPAGRDMTQGEGKQHEASKTLTETVEDIPEDRPAEKPVDEAQDNQEEATGANPS